MKMTAAQAATINQGNAIHTAVSFFRFGETNQHIRLNSCQPVYYICNESIQVIG
jgi:hypothetical protein